MNDWSETKITGVKFIAAGVFMLYGAKELDGLLESVGSPVWKMSLSALLLVTAIGGPICFLFGLYKLGKDRK